MPAKKQSNTQELTPNLDGLPVYRSQFKFGRWQVIRINSGHVECLCSSEAEAEKLALSLNSDYAANPKAHYVT